MRPKAHRRVLVGAAAAVAAVIAVCVAAVPFDAAQLRIAAYAAMPPIEVLAGLALFFGVAWGTRHSESRRLVHVLLAGILFVMHLSVEVQPLGDYSTWRSWLPVDRVGGSELLANWVYRRVYVLCGPAGTDYVAPCAGLLFSLAFLSFVESSFSGDRRQAARRRLLGAAMLALSGWQLLFFRGYLENSQLSLPFVVMGVAGMVALARGRGGVLATAVCSAWLTLACLVHGMNVAMLLALALVLAWRRRRRARLLIGDLATMLGTAAALVAATVWLLTRSGHQLLAAHMQGGGDDRHFVPFVLAGLPNWYEFAMLDVAHLADVGNNCLLVAPVFVGCLVLLALPRTRARLTSAILRQPALATAGLGAAALTAIYYFDLMFPRDYDLMVGMGAPINLLAVQCALAVRGIAARWIVVVIGLGGVHAWVVMAAQLVPSSPAVADDMAVLEVNRRTGDVHCRAGEWMFLEVEPAASIVPPFRLQVFGWNGALPETVPGPAAELGLLFPRPGDEGDPSGRALLVVDQVQKGHAGGGAIVDARYVSLPIPCEPMVDALTLQAVLTDVRGGTAVSRPVRVVPPPR